MDNQMPAEQAELVEEILQRQSRINDIAGSTCRTMNMVLQTAKVNLQTMYEHLCEINELAKQLDEMAGSTEASNH